MTEPTPQPDRVVQIDINAPITQVWDEITKTGRIQRAVYNTVLDGELRPGGRLRYYSPNRKRVFVVGEVKEIEPPHRFVHTYVMTLNPDPPTLVTWELEERDGACRVTLIHSGWTDAHKTADKTAAGWEEILGLLKAQVETGQIPLKTRVMYGVMGLFSFALPKTTTVDYADRQGW
ncbi:MAG: SRPBCC domain-containing protein [Gemmatimonadota bacterium]|nr:SRPBCC domain-containing protein [Gemmatimonadota bacterium]